MTIYELRIYTTIPGRMPALLKRFEDHTLRIWKKHGIEQVGFWSVHFSLVLFNQIDLNQADPRWPKLRQRTHLHAEVG